MCSKGVLKQPWINISTADLTKVLVSTTWHWKVSKAPHALAMLPPGCSFGRKKRASDGDFLCKFPLVIPLFHICSYLMYGLFTYIWVVVLVVVGKKYHTLSVWDRDPKIVAHFCYSK